MESCTSWRESLNVQLSFVFIGFIYILLHFYWLVNCFMVSAWRLVTSQGAEFKIQWLSTRLTFLRPIPLAGSHIAVLLYFAAGPASQQGLLRSNIVQLDGVAEHNAFRFPRLSSHSLPFWRLPRRLTGSGPWILRP